MFTDNMSECVYTNSYRVERHHIFGGANRKRSEKYGYVVPLRPDYHPNGAQFDRRHGDIDTELKQMAQRHYERHHGTRQEFIAEFGKNYL